MKCPKCWTEKAYLRPVKGWMGMLLSCLLLVPLKCHHCYHKFCVFWFFTLGQRLEPPTMQVTPRRPRGESSDDEAHKAPLRRMPGQMPVKS